MFTSRAEYRILLRMDDADMRLTEKGWKLGLVKADRYELYRNKRILLMKSLISPELIQSSHH